MTIAFLLAASLSLNAAEAQTARRAAPEGQRVPKEAFARWLAGELLGHAP
jgi:hypothetical protein